MLYIQREHDIDTSDTEMKFTAGTIVDVLHCLTTDESFIRIYDAIEGNIADGNGGFFIPQLSPITLSDYQAQLLKGIRQCDGYTIVDSSGNNVEDEYNFVQMKPVADLVIKGATGKAGEFLQVSKVDPVSNQLLGIANFRKIGK